MTIVIDQHKTIHRRENKPINRFKFHVFGVRDIEEGIGYCSRLVRVSKHHAIFEHRIMFAIRHRSGFLQTLGLELPGRNIVQQIGLRHDRQQGQCQIQKSFHIIFLLSWIVLLLADAS